MPETRRIENYGVLKLLPEERGSNNLLILCDVIQLPFSEYLNLKTNPSRSHYGYVCYMAGEYVLDVKDIQFRRQVIVDRDRYLVQLAWQEFCNSKTIAGQLGAPLPDTPVEYPIWLCDELRFRLEPGVVINMFKSHVPPITCSGSGIVEPDYSPEAPGLPPNPSAPPPKGTPDSEKLPLSSPYEGANDAGNTYVRGDGSTPFYRGDDGAGVYMVYSFNEPPSYDSTKKTFIQKMSDNPSDINRFSVGPRCGSPRPNGTIPGISIMKDGSPIGCAEDNTAILVSMSFFSQT